MGIRFTCPNGHKLHVKSFLAGKRGVCPHCGAKILIPPEQPPEEQAAPAAQRFERIGQVESSASAAVTLSDPGTASVIIAIADSTLGGTPVLDTPVPVPTIAPALPPAMPKTPPTPVPIVSSPPATAPPLLVANAVEPVSPAVRYIAQRERNRRNQFMFAVMLLLAVIVLAGVLVFVLLRGAGNAPAKPAQTTNYNDFRSTRHVAVIFERCSNAHGALAATT